MFDGFPFPEWHETVQAVWNCTTIVVVLGGFGYFATRTRTVSGWLGATIGATLAGLGIILYYTFPQITSSLIAHGHGDSLELAPIAIMVALNLLNVVVMAYIGWKTAKIVKLPGWFGAVMAVLAAMVGLLIVAVIGQVLYRHRLRKQKALQRWYEDTPDSLMRPYGHQPPAPSELV
jgi:hypothetical protein